MTPDPFSNPWCDRVNSAVALQLSARCKGQGSEAEPTTGSGATDVPALDVRVRLLKPDGEEVRGVITLTPLHPPYARVGPDLDSTCGAEIELPIGALDRISGRSIGECAVDRWLSTATRVSAGMEALFEMAARYGYQSPLRWISMPDL